MGAGSGVAVKDLKHQYLLNYQRVGFLHPSAQLAFVILKTRTLCAEEFGTYNFGISQ